MPGLHAGSGHQFQLIDELPDDIRISHLFGEEHLVCLEPRNNDVEPLHLVGVRSDTQLAAVLILGQVEIGVPDYHLVLDPRNKATLLTGYLDTDLLGFPLLGQPK